MADILIKHLKQKGSEHSALSMLVNQWGFDEILIPKALQTIGSMFPHYSRHDESHSKQILVNIERLLGDNISLLTATDTWLILEAAYWHDIGMVVPQADIDSAWKTEEFKIYLEEICNSPNHELFDFVKNFDSNDISKCFKGADTPIGAVSKFRELMAEWFRRQHPQRADSIVQAPWGNAGINSPRTELIPARLFKLLGRICLMHGAPFKEILNPNGLAFRETGLAQEDCHPRFVACLLRMGDLLDLDDNRFCPVMQRIAGDNRSHHSKSHEDKHAGIRHLRIDRERIEINSECTTIDGYLEASKWFDWLSKEMQDQMANWQDIVPSRALGLLPTLGPVNVKLQGDLQILQEGKRPQFTIDGERAIKILQGSNLYTTPFAYIRELLQNAIDATLIKTWIRESSKHPSSTWESPEKAKEILEKYYVEVSLTELEETKNNKTIWSLKITDSGTGISIKDLSFMMKIGASQKNTERQNIIRNMPEWMKPSGAFGIGLQSAFLICSELKIRTKSIFSNETLNIALHSPTGKYEGLIQINKLAPEMSEDYGSTLELFLELNTYPDRWSFSHEKNTVTQQILSLLDPVLDGTLPVEATKIADSIAEFSKRSPINIKAEFKTLKHGCIKLKTGIHTIEEIYNPRRFYKIDQHELEISYTPSAGNRYQGHWDMFYRGQAFEYKNSYLPHVGLSVNLLSGVAGAWLNANRDAIAPHAEEALDEVVVLALAKKIEHDLNNPDECPQITGETKLPELSFFLEAMAIEHPNQWRGLANKIFRKWLDLKIQELTFRELFDRPSWTFEFESSINRHRDTTCDAVLPESWDSRTSRIIFNAWSETKSHCIQIFTPNKKQEPKETKPLTINQDFLSLINTEDKYQLNYKLSKTPIDPYTDSALATALAMATQFNSLNTRYILNTKTTDWDILHIDPDAEINARELFQTTYLSKTKVLLPFLFIGNLTTREKSKVQATDDQIKKISEYVKPFLLKPATTIEIENSYRKLIEYIDKVMIRSEHCSLWLDARESLNQ